MRRGEPWLSVAVAAMLAAACGGEEVPPAGAGATARAVAAGAAQAPTDTAVASQVDLVRESFSYRGGGRDPFISLLRSGEVRPLLEDLRVVAITYDLRYPGNSVAVLRDTTVGRRYTVRAGDAVGRFTIAQIRPDAVVVIFEEFGAERQEVLWLRRRQEGAR